MARPTSCLARGLKLNQRFSPVWSADFEQTKRRLLLMFPSVRSMTPFTRLVLLALMMVVLPLSVTAQPDPARQQPSPEPAKPEPSRRPEQPAAEDENRPREPMSTPTFNGLRFRSIGPAFTSGRVIGFAVDPNNSAHYFVASASGGVWKTVNNGTTWTPVFDREGSYSIGAIALDQIGRASC